MRLGLQPDVPKRERSERSKLCTSRDRKENEAGVRTSMLLLPLDSEQLPLADAGGREPRPLVSSQQATSRVKGRTAVLERLGDGPTANERDGEHC